MQFQSQGNQRKTGHTMELMNQLLKDCRKNRCSCSEKPLGHQKRLLDDLTNVFLGISEKSHHRQVTLYKSMDYNETLLI